MTDLFDNYQKFVILSLVQLAINNTLHVTKEVYFLLLLITFFLFSYSAQNQTELYRTGLSEKGARWRKPELMEVQLSLAGKETMFVQSLDMLYTVSVNKKVGCVIESMASNWNMSAFW